MDIDSEFKDSNIKSAGDSTSMQMDTEGPFTLKVCYALELLI